MNLKEYDDIHYYIVVTTDKEELQDIKEALETVLLEYPSHTKQTAITQTINDIKEILEQTPTPEY